ncbi:MULTISPECIES: sulfotransferase [Sulfitobacter]|uniref:sulfotransferase n=1 Tax=Sulfitobacter TaxID=60136 RepID=UPI002307612D|nr:MULTISPECIES: sulfotransferase [Sulfitobacter]MDF3382729.1 sulfotransferase family protein [Sulfitobacter sp. Ks11]MDF3386148.1 sulfotransferase family protein [Sulfitobacter sp. M85]MDF3389567.1 sulfotransferase family protein [Sulfitobacter sp. Ks16]MDF3400204.1 sulfotransferase family protein [Sulfitobacter sp. KE39]MDF3403625.1 sulfotransferase family protein [Sulfitobacter sp. Ks35]
MTGPRIVNLGLPKTGTTTLTDALRHAGLKVADWRIRKGQSSSTEITGAHVGRIIYADYFASGDPLARLHEFDVINEMSAVRHDRSLWPQTDWGVLNAIQHHHPEVKFLLSHRDPARTANSMMRWNNLGRRRLPQADVPGLPRGFGRDEAELARWIEGHFAFCRRVFAGCANFLEFDIEDPEARDKIADYLEIDLPWWGQSNTGKAEAG